MHKELVGLGFHGWYESVFGALTADRREMYDRWRWAWKKLESRGEDKTCHAIVHTILSTSAEQLVREVQRLNKDYALYEEDARRLASSLANLDRGGWKMGSGYR